MFGFEFASLSIWINALLFAVAAAVIWFAGTRISVYADNISEQTGLGSAVMGLLFLALATETPEIGTTVSAGLSGNAELATNNIFGGITLQTAVLAIVDLWVVRGALTFFTPKPVLLLEGSFLILLISLALAAAVAGEFLTVFGFGMWSVILLVIYLVSLIVIHRYEGQERWSVTDEEELNAVEEAAAAAREEQEPDEKDRPLSRLILLFAGGTALIFVAGFVLARVGEALAEQTGLGSSFVGVTLLAASTSLPELSTTISAARLGNYSMAVSNIFGSNALMIMLIFIADIAYRQGPILETVGASSLFAAATGIVVTAIYLLGMIEWKDRTIWRMGIDSAAVLVCYLGSLGVLYTLR